MTVNDFHEKWARFGIPVLVTEHTTLLDYQKYYLIYIHNWELFGFQLSDGKYLGVQKITMKTNPLIKPGDPFTTTEFNSPLGTKLGEALYG